MCHLSLSGTMFGRNMFGICKEFIGASVWDGIKFLNNRMGAEICDSYNAGNCDPTRPGNVCPCNSSRVHLCNICLKTHPACRHGSGPSKGGGKGKKGGKKGKNNSTPHMQG